MARDIYCWRCDMVIPMLEDHEWEIVEPLLRDAIGGLKRHRQEHGVSLADAMPHAGAAALEKYEELTGFKETNVNALWHHVISQYGPPCVSCGKPLRTPRASFCAACGAARVIRIPD